MKNRGIVALSLAVMLQGCMHPNVGRPHWQSPGTQITDPHHSERRYYFASRDRVCRSEFSGAPYGLWASADSGNNWERLSDLPGFEDVFVHPKTGKLYAILLVEFMRREPNALLIPLAGRKIATSESGKDWVDITPGRAYIPNILVLFVDPDHPDRIGALCEADSYSYYQSVDADYSEWKQWTEPDWEASHPDWSRHTPFETRGVRIIPRETN